MLTKVSFSRGELMPFRPHSSSNSWINLRSPTGIEFGMVGCWAESNQGQEGLPAMTMEPAPSAI